jgi:hypothetical protein
MKSYSVAVDPQYHGRRKKPRIEFSMGMWNAYIPRLERRFYYKHWLTALACVEVLGAPTR